MIQGGLMEQKSKKSSRASRERVWEMVVFGNQANQRLFVLSDGLSPPLLRAQCPSLLLMGPFCLLFAHGSGMAPQKTIRHFLMHSINFAKWEHDWFPYGRCSSLSSQLWSLDSCIFKKGYESTSSKAVWAGWACQAPLVELKICFICRQWKWEC